MRSLTLLTLFAFITFTTCKKGVEAGAGDNDKPCASMPCTLNFASVSVQFLDKNGHAVIATNFKSVNTRTGAELKYSGPNYTYIPGRYTVASDSNLKELSDTGDDVSVTATNPATSQTKTATFKLAGGCTCHINKISGPSEVVFD